jgi:ABC-type taurine transport system ATPase subunit
MQIYPEMEAAMRADDVDRYVALMDEDFEYVRHKSRDSLSRDQMAELLRKVWRQGNRTIEDMRCLYENDEILVVHTRLSFASGSREGAMIVNIKRDGKIVRIESGVSDLS